MSTDLLSLIPSTKFEIEKAATLVQLGFPTVEPVLPQILEWLQDLNWPVGLVFKPFLACVGQPLAPYVRAILASKDDCWKYSLLSAVVAQSAELARALRPELQHLATNPSAGELKEEVNQIATEIMEAFNLGAPEA